MEHLFIDLSNDVVAERTLSAYESVTLNDNQPHINSKASLMPPVQPASKWLCFDHDNLASAEYPLLIDLARYPSVRGWDMEAWWDQGDLRRAHPSFQDTRIAPVSVSQQVAAMIQSWLVFGFLEAVLGKRVHTSYLLRYDSDGQPYLHFGNLTFAFMAWKIEIWQKTPMEAKEIYDRTYDNFKVVAGVIQQLLLWTATENEFGKRMRKHFPGFCEATIALTPSINRLVDVVCTVRDQIHSTSGDRMVVMTGLPGAIEDRQRRLVQRGWCPFLLQYCEIKLHYSVLDWLDGSILSDACGGHTSCTNTGCVRNNIDPSTYKPRHCSDSCRCPVIAPKLQDVLDVIDAGDIPVVRVVNSGDTRLVVTRQSSENPGSYVAISHVWVDGLGSTTEVGLPKCQVEKLGDLIQNATTDNNDVLFWIDSLCIPSSSEQRKKSIGLLRNIYRHAAKVVVIDRTIQQCPKDASCERLLWSIVASPWMQRLWTYQESYLAAKVLFLLADNFLLEVDQKLPASSLPTAVQIVRTSLVQVLNPLRPDEGLGASARQTNIGEVASAISWRSTSRISDEVLAIAALLKVDTQYLAALPSEERMRNFYLEVGLLPHDIIFYDGPRLPWEPFRWAPATLMSRSLNAMDDTPQGQCATCTSEGLKCQYLVMTFNEVVQGEDDVSYYAFDDAEQAFYQVYWAPSYRNLLNQKFDGVVFRSVQGGSVLKPDLNLGVEGIAILADREAAGDSTVTYAGRMTATKHLKDDRNDQLERTYPSILSCRWEMKDLLIR